MTNWLDVVTAFRSPRFVDTMTAIDMELDQGTPILPVRENILKAFRLTPFHKVKVVILGQDPYPNPEHAMGLAFSVPSDTKQIPPTLLNITKELETDVNITSFDTDLTRWAKQGVLLMNTSLTVQRGMPGSHANRWTFLTTEVIKKLSDEHEHLVFILWGNHAQRKAQFIDDSKHLIIASPHPSPLAAYRGFFGSRPFSRTNDYLIAHGKDPINW